MNRTIDVEAVRDFLTDYAGTAAFSGFPTAMLDVMEIWDLDARGLCLKAEHMGIDLDDFVVSNDDDDDDDADDADDADDVDADGFDDPNGLDEW